MNADIYVALGETSSPEGLDVEDAGCGCRETSTPQLWDNQVPPPPLQSPAPPQLSNARIRTPLAVMDLSWLQLYLSSFHSLLKPFV